MGGRKEERPRPVIEEVYERAGPRNVPAQHAERFRERSNLYVDPPVQPEMVDSASPVLAENTACMSVIDHHDAVELLGKVTQSGQCAEVAIHAEYAVTDD